MPERRPQQLAQQCGSASALKCLGSGRQTPAVTNGVPVTSLLRWTSSRWHCLDPSPSSPVLIAGFLQHKEDKMQRTASQFQEMEQTVYNSLFTLIKDTSVLRDYAAAALLIINVSADL
eukprot:GHRQ01028057.1.p1 GENE.GHRQ01028057.1~~GHRQ01028057.1.p1  ORF type:complete len:118 (-),score=30.08 GHRQ01028057.1:453-806(-)